MRRVAVVGARALANSLLPHDDRARLAAAALLRPEVVIGLDLGTRGPHFSGVVP